MLLPKLAAQASPSIHLLRKSPAPSRPGSRPHRCRAAPEPVQGGGFSWDSVAPGIMQMMAARDEAQFLASKGQFAAAKHSLQNGIEVLDRTYGERALCVEALHIQLFMLHYRDGEYKQALQEAEAALRVGRLQYAEEGNEVALHRMRLGMALLAYGDPEAALPHLAHASSRLGTSLQRHRDAFLKRAEEEGYESTPEDLENYRTMMVAHGEARYYSALCMLRLEGEEADERELGAIEGALAGGLEQMALALGGDAGGDVLRSALREHARAVKSSLFRDEPEGRQWLEAQHGMLQQTLEGMKDFLEQERQGSA